MEPKPKKIFVIPQKILFYQKEDKNIQQKQNRLILMGIWVSTTLGVLAIAAQVLEVIVSWK